MFHHYRALDAQLKAKGLGMLWHWNARMGHAVRLVKVGVIQPNIHFEECWACITVLKSYMCQSFNNFFNSNTVCFTLLFIPGHSISAAQPCGWWLPGSAQLFGHPCRGTIFLQGRFPPNPSSVVDLNILNLDPDPEIWPNLDPDPGPDPDHIKKYNNIT